MLNLDPQSVTRRILDQIENRVELVCSINGPTMKVIALPLCESESSPVPVISPAEIYELSRDFPDFSSDRYKRVPGGVCYILEHLYLELNEYGIVYYTAKLHEEKEEEISLYEFIDGNARLLSRAASLYDACEALENIAVVAELVNVFGKKLSKIYRLKDYRPLDLPPHRVCYAQKFYASTSDHYLSSDFYPATQQISEELTMQLLWAFNIPTDREVVQQVVQEVVRDAIENPYTSLPQNK